MGDEPAVDKASLLAPAYTDNLIVELCSRCDLRCTYCPKSQRGNNAKPGHDQTMGEEVFSKVLEYLDSLVRDGEQCLVMHSGVGETTAAAGWTHLSERLLAYPGRHFIVTNLAHELDDAELDLLCRFDEVILSVDTLDPALSRKLRRGFSFETFDSNLRRLSERVASSSPRKTNVSVNCTLTDLVAPGLSELATYARSHGLSLQVSGLMELEPLPDQPPTANVSALDDEAFAELCAQIEEATKLYDGSDLVFHVQPNLADIVARRRASRDTGAVPPFHEPGPGGAPPLTRFCLQPWERINVGADGSIYLCCQTIEEPVGNILREGIHEATTGEAARSFREALLEGRLPDACVTCSNAPPSGVDELERVVTGLHLSRLRGDPRPSLHKG